MMISNENTGKGKEEGKFSCAVSRKDVGSNSIFYQLFRCWMQKKCSCIRGKLNEDSTCKCQTQANQKTDLTEDCPG